MQKIFSENIQKESTSYKQSCMKMTDEISELKSKLDEKEYEIRELRYEVKRLTKTEME